ncbi:hypothetical protein [Aestuariimicrobium ganziense]|uniref:hypothetical protein n=1 Tax=Aestuariimicrobium ganziense TaxID=2773677 RepID=UPI001941D46F|nr:hypothetical protein [Aestuariimicrobium ganziense]
MPFFAVVETGFAWADGQFRLDDVLSPIGIGLDYLAVVADPLGALIGQALDFLLGLLIDYAASLCPPLDALWGAPDQIVGYSEKVHQSSAKLADAANLLADAAAALTIWAGQGAQAYLDVLKGAYTSVSAQSALNANMADLWNAVGCVAAMVKEFLWGLIIDRLAAWIKEGLVALAASVPSLGTSIGIYTGWVAASYAWTFGKVMNFLSEAADEIDDIAEMLKINNKWLDSLEDVFGSAASSPIVPNIPNWVAPIPEGAGNAGGTFGDPSDSINPFPS